MAPEGCNESIFVIILSRPDTMFLIRSGWILSEDGTVELLLAIVSLAYLVFKLHKTPVTNGKAFI